MASENGREPPFLIAGGGIGGLAAAYALARHGFPVRVLEQADEFREIGAGIQLGPNIFRALDKIGLKDAMLADAWQPGKLRKCAMRSPAKLITGIPLDEQFLKRFQQPYAVTHRADIHGAFLKACQRPEPRSRSRPRAAVDDFRGPRRRRRRSSLDDGEQVARPRADRLRRPVVENPRARSSATASRASPATSPIAPCSRREDVPEDLWRPDVMLWAGPRTHFVHYPLRRGELYNLVAVFHSDRYVEGWNTRGRPEELLCEHFKGQRPRGAAHAGAHRDLAHVGAVRPRAGEGLVARAASRCSATPRIRCCNISRRAPAWRPRTRSALAEKVAAHAGRSAGAFKAYQDSALSAHRPGADHGARLRRVLSRARRRRGAARPDARQPHARAGL